MRDTRGDFGTPGTDSPSRRRRATENLARLREIRRGRTPIHLFTLTVAVMLPLGIWTVKHGRIEAFSHRDLCVAPGLGHATPGRLQRLRPRPHAPPR